MLIQKAIHVSFKQYNQFKTYHALNLKLPETETILNKTKMAERKYVARQELIHQKEVDSPKSDCQRNSFID